MKGKYKVSIVTPTFNQGEFIEETINSVLEQGYANIEYIIIDGGSTDNTLNIIKKYQKYLKYWVSEPDKGQANAINKGLKHCTGDIFNWLNSDDYLAKDALFNIVNAFEVTNADAIAGRTIYFESDQFRQPEQLGNITYENLMFWRNNIVFVQPGLWLRTNFVREIGGLDERFHFAFDSFMLIKYLFHYPNVSYINDDLVYFRLHDSSKTVSNPAKFVEERERFMSILLHESDDLQLIKSAEEWLDNNYWSAYLRSVSSEDCPKLQKILRLLKGALSKPQYRLNRKSAGAIKQILLND